MFGKGAMMAGNGAFLRAEHTLAWLGQFDLPDQEYMVRMLKAMKLVGRDSFAECVRERILETHKGVTGRVGLYVEREMLPENATPAPIFQQTESRPRRAFGEGPLPIVPNEKNPGDVGSEGIVAQLISELCREFPNRFISHPGPDRIRDEKQPIRKLVVVTDLIGSGDRAYRYLDAFWSVFSVKSWWSGRRANELSFEVVAYAATEDGLVAVRSHRLCPIIRLVSECPTIDNSFDGVEADCIRDVCIKYNPRPRKKPALGYKDTGALIAFAHGAPNNSPRVLHVRSPSWEPLFPKRVTSSSRENFSDVVNQEDVQERLVRMRHRNLNQGVDWSRASPATLNLYLVFAALSRPPRTAEVVARKTGLTMLEVEKILRRAATHGLIDGENRLTSAGHAQLVAAKKKRKAIATVDANIQSYYPSTLRAPRASSR